MDDTAVYRPILTEVMEACLKETEISACSSGRTAPARLDLALEERVLLDMEISEMSSLETLKSIRRQHPATNAIMIIGTPSAEAPYPFEALAQGALKRSGCHCLTQSEDSCVVYGMPMAVDEAGLSDEQVALPRLAPRIARLVSSGRTA